MPEPDPAAAPSSRFARWYGSDGPVRSFAAKLLRHPSAVLVVNTGFQSVLRLASNVVLARLLTPDAFAVTAIVMLFLFALQMVSDVGIGILALREATMDEDRQARLWTMQVVRGLALTATLVLLSEPIAWLYGRPELGSVVRVLALMPALQAAQGLYPVLATASRDLLPSVVTELGGRVIGTIVSIGYALVSPTVWALVAGTLAQFAASALVSYRFKDATRPRVAFDWSFMREQWRFARWIQLSSIFTFIGAQIDKALFPFLFGLHTFGLYTIGATFAAMPQQLTSRWTGAVFFPLATEQLRLGDAGRDRLLPVRQTMLLYAAVMSLAVMAAAPMFFRFLYTPAYYPAAAFAQLLGPVMFFDVAEGSLRNLLVASDKPQFEAPTVTVRVTVFLALAAWVYAAGGGAGEYALAYVGGNVAAWAFILLVDVRHGYLTPRADLLIAVPLLAAEALAYTFPTPPLRPLVAAAGGVAVAAVAAAATALIFRRRGLPSLPKAAIMADELPPIERESTDRAAGVA